MYLDKLLADLELEKATLKEHNLYGKIRSKEDVERFMSHHVYAVWDFMSLLKALQVNLTGVEIPWMPIGDPAIRRFINEIVLAEETDVDKNGKVMSHFEMYLEAMKELGINIQPVLDNIALYREGKKDHLPTAVREFLDFTFSVIATKKNHLIAAVFTFGREDLIPDMFIELVKELKDSGVPGLEGVLYYFERHIELDGDEHGPLALKLVSSLCTTPEEWEEATAWSKRALEQRNSLWNSIERVIELENKADELVNH